MTKNLRALTWQLSSASQGLRKRTLEETSETEEVVFEETFIDLRQDAWVRDTRPLMTGCTCHACRSHTRAYIHHLFKCEEMLGEVLLYTHNRHQLMCLFEEVRMRLPNREAFAKWAALEEPAAVIVEGDGATQQDEED